METKVIKLNSDNDIDKLRLAGDIIKKGGLVAFPTETVYGLGGDAFNKDSSMKIYAAKGRPSDNPLIVHIAQTEDLCKVAKDVPDNVYKLADKFWPGPLTIILNKVPGLPYQTTGGLDTVAVRMPSHRIAREFIKFAGGFVAAPSANVSGRPSPTCAKYVIEYLQGRVDMIIDGGDSDIGLESTIVDMTVNPPMILRPGYITYEDLSEVIDDVVIDQTIIDANATQKPKAPGMKYRHYAPKADLVIVKGQTDDVIRYINEKTTDYKKEGKKVGVIATEDNKDKYIAEVIKNIGSKDNEELIAKNLFRILREFDDEEVEFIFAEGFSQSGISMATMNRLLKAAGHKEVDL